MSENRISVLLQRLTDINAQLLRGNVTTELIEEQQRVREELYTLRLQYRVQDPPQLCRGYELGGTGAAYSYVRTAFEQAVRETKQCKEELALLLASFQAEQRSLITARQQLQNITAALRTAERENATLRAQRESLEDEVNELQDTIDRLDQENEQLEEQVEEDEQVLEQLEVVEQSILTSIEGGATPAEAVAAAEEQVGGGGFLGVVAGLASAVANLFTAGQASLTQQIEEALGTIQNLASEQRALANEPLTFASVAKILQLRNQAREEYNKAIPDDLATLSGEASDNAEIAKDYLADMTTVYDNANTTFTAQLGAQIDTIERDSENLNDQITTIAGNVGMSVDTRRERIAPLFARVYNNLRRLQELLDTLAASQLYASVVVKARDAQTRVAAMYESAQAILAGYAAREPSDDFTTEDLPHSEVYKTVVETARSTNDANDISQYVARLPGDIETYEAALGGISADITLLRDQYKSTRNVKYNNGLTLLKDDASVIQNALEKLLASIRDARRNVPRKTLDAERNPANLAARRVAFLALFDTLNLEVSDDILDIADANTQDGALIKVYDDYEKRLQRAVDTARSLTQMTFRTSSSARIQFMQSILSNDQQQIQAILGEIDPKLLETGIRLATDLGHAKLASFMSTSKESATPSFVSLSSYISNNDVAGLRKHVATVSKQYAQAALLAVVDSNKPMLVKAFIETGTLGDKEWDIASERAESLGYKQMVDALLDADTKRVQNEVRAKKQAPKSGPSVVIKREKRELVDVLPRDPLIVPKQQPLASNVDYAQLRQRVRDAVVQGQPNLPVQGFSASQVREAFKSAVQDKDLAFISTVTYTPTLSSDDWTAAFNASANNVELHTAVITAIYRRTVKETIETLDTKGKKKITASTPIPVARTTQKSYGSTSSNSSDANSTNEWSAIAARIADRITKSKTDTEAYRIITDAHKELQLLTQTKNMHPEKFITEAVWKNGIQTMRQALVDKQLLRGNAHQQLDYLSNKYYFRP